jgi:hypothetical protein
VPYSRHKMPKIEETLKWQRALQRNDLPRNVIVYVCSTHFLTINQQHETQHPVWI